MSAAEGDRTQRYDGSSAPVPPRTRASDEVDVPSILAGEMADLYASLERERRDVSTERAIARARGAA